MNALEDYLQDSLCDGFDKTQLTSGTGKTIHILTQFDWDYQNCEPTQMNLAEIIRENPESMVLIVCSHPTVLTHGSGLQKGEGTESLIQFDPASISDSPVPLYKIKRGGGLTIHHPGQIIFYPIINLNKYRRGLPGLILQLLKSTQDVLKKFEIEDLDINKKLLGLWRNEKKVASVGIGLERFVSLHGMAINWEADPTQTSLPKNLFPCGLNSDTYSSLKEQYSSLSHVSRDEFVSLWIESFCSAL